MKKFLFSIVSFFLLCVNASASEKLYLFHRYDCPHCQKEIAFLEEIKKGYPNVEFIYLEVVKRKENLKHLENVKQTLGDDTPYVPYAVIGNQSFIGFNEDTKEQIKKYLTYCSKNSCEDVVGKIIQEGRSISLEKKKAKTQEEFALPFLGKVNAKDVSLPLLSVILGFLDGFNPCAMWVLLFLISMLLGMKNKRRMWILGGGFLLASAITYALFLVAWFKINLALQDIFFLRTLIALFALGTGCFHLIRYRKMRHRKAGCTVVHEKRRNKIRKQIQMFTKEKSLVLGLIGVISLAISVNLIELACSAGFPLVYTQILSLNDLSFFTSIFYILLYIFFYLIDDFLIFCIAMFTLKITGITNKYQQYSHLPGGLLLLLIGWFLLFHPEILLFSM